MSRGRERYSEGYLVLTPTRLWQAHWFPYVKDHATGKDRRIHKSKIVGRKAEMAKFQAKKELAKLIKPVNAAGGTIKDDRDTLGWFIHKQWKPMREGRWRHESTRSSAEECLAVISKRFGTTKLCDLDRVELQAWLNELARTSSRHRVWHVRLFLKSICAEAVDLDFISKDPARKLMRPITRGPDETTLEWHQYSAVLAKLSLRDRLIVKVAAGCAVRPGELFAFRWRCLRTLGERRILEVRETVYRGVLRPYAKTSGSADYVALPIRLSDELEQWRDIARYRNPEHFIFPNSHGGFISRDNFLGRVLRPLCEHKNEKGETVGILGIHKLDFQILRRTFATRAYAEKLGSLKDIQKQLRHAKPITTLENYIKDVPETVFAMVDAIYNEIVPEGTNLAEMALASGREQ